MLKHAMPQDLIDKFHMVRIQAPASMTPEEKEEFESVESYHFPMPGHEVNCWFQIYRETHITDPNFMIFSVREEGTCISIPVAALHEKTPLQMFAYIKEECKKAHADKERRAMLN